MFPSERTAPRHLSKHLFKISTEYTYELTKRLHSALHELKPKKTTLYSHLLSLLNLQKLIGHLTLPKGRIHHSAPNEVFCQLR